MSEAPGPLDGIRVLEPGLLVQGPQAAAMLGDMGADVIKIEHPKFGDHSRAIAISETDVRSAYFIACNRGKRSVALDLSTSEGANVFKLLAKTSDIIISNFQSGTMDSWGLGYSDLQAVNPRLVVATGNTFGPAGPDRLRKGADLAAQCAGGLVRTTGRDEDPPSPVGITIADHISCLNMVGGILAALYEATRTGIGKKVEVSLLGGQIWAQASEFTHSLITGKHTGRANYGHPLLHGFYRIFETLDGWLGLIGIPPSKFEEFFVIVERTEILLHDRFQKERITHEDVQWVLTQLEPTFRSKTTDDWCSIFEKTEIRYAPVRNYEQVVEDDGAWENGYFVEAEDAAGNVVRHVNTPIRFNEQPLQPRTEVPAIGQHTDEVLKEIEISSEEIQQLRESGVTQ